MKKYLITISAILAFASSQAQQNDTYVAPTGNMVTFAGAQMAIFGDLINDARGTATTATTTQTGVNHAGGGDVYLYRHSVNGTGNSRIYDGPTATAATSNYNASGSAVRFFNLFTDNNVGTASPSGTAVNGAGGSGQIQIEQEACITNQHTFVNGIVWTPRNKWKHAFVHYDADAAAYAGAGVSNTKFTSPATNMQVDGYVAKTGASNFVFPIGDGIYTRFGGIVSPGSGEYKCAYFAKNAQVGTTGISGNVASTGPMNGGITKVNTTEFWDFDGTASSQFMQTALNSVSGYSDWGISANFSGYDASKIVITAFDAWENLAITGTPSALTNDGPYTTTVATSPDAGNFSAYTWANVASPLLITLSSFTGNGNNCDAILNWSTAVEENSKDFLVQKSMDGVNFATVATVSAKGNSRNSTYSSKVAQSEVTSYYRLRLGNKDGSATYSGTIAVHTNCNGTDGYVKVYPNPVGLNENVYVSFTTAFSSRAAILITNNLGQQLLSKVVNVSTGTNVLPVDMSNLAAGTYYLRVISDYGQQIIKTQKVLKN